MLRQFQTLFAATLLVACASASDVPGLAEPAPASPEWRLVIHGGAGVIRRENMSPDAEAAFTAALEEALEAGAAVLRNGGSALDAVEAAVLPMEDNPLFNAGHGAVFTADAGHELDASIMEGSRRDAGAVAGVTRVRNPIRAARAVMEQSEHVMFAGAGADAFAEGQGLEMVENSYFSTESRRLALERVLEERARTDDADRHGTVGAVAIDMAGNLAAATTTGGMTAKAAGRIGDAPLIGAATYAQNGVCAVSATGHGEYFIRVGVAKTICDRVALAGETIEEAAQNALDQVAELGGDGGVVVLDGSGHFAYVFNSEGMYRGMIDASSRETAIYGPAPMVRLETDQPVTLPDGAVLTLTLYDYRLADTDSAYGHRSLPIAALPLETVLPEPETERRIAGPAIRAVIRSADGALLYVSDTVTPIEAGVMPVLVLRPVP